MSELEENRATKAAQCDGIDSPVGAASYTITTTEYRMTNPRENATTAVHTHHPVNQT